MRSTRFKGTSHVQTPSHARFHLKQPRPTVQFVAALPQDSIIKTVSTNITSTVNVTLESDCCNSLCYDLHKASIDRLHCIEITLTPPLNAVIKTIDRSRESPELRPSCGMNVAPNSFSAKQLTHILFNSSKLSIYLGMPTAPALLHSTRSSSHFSLIRDCLNQSSLKMK